MIKKDVNQLKAFERIQIVPIHGPALAGPNEHQWAARHCQAALRAGIGEIQVNYPYLPLHPELVANPKKVYHWFSNFATSLDQFAISRLFRGVYPKALVDLNFRRMKTLATEAVKVGLKPSLFCAEPRFVPNRFFDKRPDLRGARVDNPSHSATPYFALCTDLKEVREHYQEMLEEIMREIPQITTLSLFTADSGSGFCYCESYTGTNGPSHCKRIPPADRIATFCSDLIETGRKHNSEFEVHINSSLNPELRKEISERKVNGLCVTVYGHWSWSGGMEDQWAYHQYRSQIEQVGYEAARKERLEDFRQRVEDVSVSESKPWALIDMPTIQYFGPIRYVPQPYEILRILRQYCEMGIRNISLRGILSTVDQIEYDVNSEVLSAFQTQPDANDEKILSAVLSKWDAADLNEPLSSAWRRADEAVQQRPLWSHCFGWDEFLVVGPLVPDFTKLTKDEFAYFDRISAQDELREVKGQFYFIPNLGDLKEYEYVLRKYKTHTLALLSEAAEILKSAISSTDPAKQTEQRILGEQLRHIELHHSHVTSQYHWVQIAYLMNGGNLDVTAEQIVSNEIENTKQFVTLLDNQAGKYLDMGTTKGCMYFLDPDVIDQFAERIAVMETHRKDPLKPASDANYNIC